MAWTGHKSAFSLPLIKMTSKLIPALTIAEWKHRGFTFEDEDNEDKHTVITYEGKSFRSCLVRTLADHWDMEHTMELMRREDARMRVRGHWQLRDDAAFPYYLIPEETWDKMVEAREVIRQIESALPRAREALATALHEPLHYRKVSLLE